MPRDQILQEMLVDNAWKHIEHNIQQIPTRMAEYAETFAHARLQSQMHDFPRLVSFPEPATVRVLSLNPYEIVANTLGHSASTPASKAN